MQYYVELRLFLKVIFFNNPTMNNNNPIYYSMSKIGYSWKCKNLLLAMMPGTG